MPIALLFPPILTSPSRIGQTTEAKSTQPSLLPPWSPCSHIASWNRIISCLSNSEVKLPPAALETIPKTPNKSEVGLGLSGFDQQCAAVNTHSAFNRAPLQYTCTIPLFGLQFRKAMG